MDFGDLAEELPLLFLVTAAALVLGRAGFAVVRIIERRWSGHGGLNSEVQARLLLLEEECTSLRRDLTELKDRQEFMDRLLPPAPSERGPPSPRPPGTTS